jgi:L-threonylcarbamoyladenylate synthase
LSTNINYQLILKRSYLKANLLQIVKVIHKILTLFHMKIDIYDAKKLLLSSKVVAIPTETVYGLAAIASDEKAVNKIYKIKNRPNDNPLICHFHSFSQVKEYIQDYPYYLEKLVKEFSPGPISYLAKLKPDSVLKVSTSNQDTVVFRIPNHTKTLDLLKEINLPLAAPSANTSGKFSGTNPKMIQKDLGDKIDGILDGGNSNIGLESTIIDTLNNHKIKILRPGTIGKNELLNFIEKEKLNLEVVQNQKSKNTTPGSKYKHYSPKTRLVLISKIEDFKNIKSALVLCQNQDITKIKELNGSLGYLDLGRDLKEVSMNLYHNFYILDTKNTQIGYLYLPEINSDSSLALALKNRIEKATKAE